MRLVSPRQTATSLSSPPRSASVSHPSFTAAAAHSSTEPFHLDLSCFWRSLATLNVSQTQSSAGQASACCSPKGVVSRKGTMLRGGGGGSHLPTPNRPPKPSKLNRALTFSTKRKAVLLAHCERGVKANKKQRLSSKLSGPAPENINTASVLTAQSEPFPNKKKSRENCNRSFIHRERHFFFPEQCR